MSVSTEQAHKGLLTIAAVLRAKSDALHTLGMHNLGEDLSSLVGQILEHQNVLQEAERTKIREDFNKHVLQSELMLEALLDNSGEEE